jgi:hypothetical protein
MELKEQMIKGMVNEVHSWDIESVRTKAKELYRQELDLLTEKELMNRYNNLTFNCLEDGSPRP